MTAVRDRHPNPGHGDVYIGEDGLRFVEVIQRIRPSGAALEVGCGSGLVSAALANTCHSVTAIDVVPACVTATRLTARLNGVADRVTVDQADLTEVDFPDRFDCVVANLPGVPVPPDLAYSPAGDGGPDGLRLIRLLLARAPGWLRPTSSTGRPAVLLMRFQSLGDADRALLAGELGEYARTQGWDITILCDSRVPVQVRSALTARYAADLNRDRGPDEILRLVDRHASNLGATSYYSSTLIARPGSGSVRFVDLATRHWLDRPVRLDAGRVHAAMDLVRYRYHARLRALPDGYWELGSQRYISLPMERLEALVGRWTGEPASLREVLHDVHADTFDEEPLSGRSLYTTGSLLLDALHETRLVHGA